MYNPYGLPQATITGQQWLPAYDSRSGAWKLSGDMLIDVLNAFDRPGWQKQLWVQLTWQQDEQRTPIVKAHASGVAAVTGQLHESDLAPPGGWSHSTWLITLPTNHCPGR